MTHAAENPGDYLGISGDFKWRSTDGTEEAVLRLQPGGQWWHAVHVERRGTSFASHLNLDGTATWDMVESLGRWRLSNVPQIDDVMPQSVAVRLACDSCRWASSEQGLHLTDSIVRASVDDMVEIGQVCMDYAVEWCPNTGLRSLVLHTQFESSNDIWSAIRALGFERSYHQQAEPHSDQSRGKSRKESVGNMASKPKLPWPSGVASMADGMRMAGLCAGFRARHDEENRETLRGSVPICVVFAPEGEAPNSADKKAASITEDIGVVPLDVGLVPVEVDGGNKPVENIFTISEIENDLHYGSLDGS